MADGSQGVEWRLLVDLPMSGPANMARDHGLAICSRAGMGTLRLYRWADPTVSFGRNEPAVGAYQSRANEGSDLTFVRRPTGGRAVLHDGELTYSLVFPRRAFGGLRQAYRSIQEGLVRALVELGVPAGHANGGEPLGPEAGPCFSAAAPGEVVVGSRKIVGSAQARIEGAILQHGSLLTTCDQTRLTQLNPAASVHASEAPPVTLKEILGQAPPWDTLVDALVRGMSSRLNGPLEPAELTDEELETESQLLSRYASPDWTWRR